MAANPIPPPKDSSKPLQVNLYQAKTQLSSLVERAANGEEIVIAKAGKPMARLVPIQPEKQLQPRRTFGHNFMGIKFLSEDWEKDIPLDYFLDEGANNPFGDNPGSAEPK